jgi:hypothetical protein
MKKQCLLVTLVMVGLCVLTMDVEARGGRGGGGGGRGGGGRGGYSSRGSPSRGPSMSRLPSTPRTQPVQRNVGNRQDVGRRTDTSSRQQVQQFLSTERGNVQGNRQGNLGDYGNQTRTAFNQNQRQANQNWFNNNFFDSHHLDTPYQGNRANWWRPATAAGMAAWLGWRNAPLYYDYGYDYGYDNGSDAYATDSDASTIQTYTQQPQTTTNVATQTTAAQGDWMPLGVFAIKKDAGGVEVPNRYLQLALNKEGVIAGTYYNSLTDAGYALEGLVDDQTQEAAWKIKDKPDSPTMEVGLFNLTQPQAPARVHFPDGTTQNWLLINVGSG